MFMADFLPKKDAKLVSWLVNFKAKITNLAATFNLSAEKVAQLLAGCDAVITQIQEVEQAKAALTAKTAQKEAVKKTNLGTLRTELNTLKVHPAMSAAVAADLQIVATPESFDEEAYQPEITVDVFSGYVRIKFMKRGVDGVKIYVRLKGQTGWRLLSFDTNSTYDDYTPLATPGVAEVREYQAFGVLADVQIGQPSAIVSVTFGG